MRLCAYIPVSGLTGLGPRPDRAGEPGIPHHVTIVFSDGLVTRAGTEPDPRVVAWAIRRAVRSVSRGELAVGGLVELGGDSEGRRAVCARVYGLVVHRLRAAVLDGLAAFGIEAPQSYPRFLPHLTLAYVEDGAEYTGPRPSGACTARSVRWRLDDEPWRTVRVGGADGDGRTKLGDEPGRRVIRCRYRSIDFGAALVAEAERRKAELKLEAGHVFGRPFVFVSTGAIYYRDAPGVQRGLDILESDLDSVLAIFESGESTCALDFGHDEDRAIGHVAAMWKVVHAGRPALACLPAYSERGAELVGASSHLWSSPHIEWAGEDEGDVFGAADTAEVFGRMRIAHLAVCVDPAQAHRVLTAVRLDEGGGQNAITRAGGETPSATVHEETETMDEIEARLEEMTAAIAAQGEQIAELRAMVEQAIGGGGGEGDGEMADDDKDEGDGEAGDDDEEMSEAGGDAAPASAAEVRAQLAERKRAEELARLRERSALLDELLANRRAGLPTPKGHGAPVVTTPSADDGADGGARHKRALAIKAAEKKAGRSLSYTAALTKAAAEA